MNNIDKENVRVQVQEAIIANMDMHAIIDEMDWLTRREREYAKNNLDWKVYDLNKKGKTV